MGTTVLENLELHKPWLDIKDEIDAYRKWIPLIPKFPNPIDPVKLQLEGFDWIVHSYLTTLPVIAQHMEAIEQHLEVGLAEGKTFIRPEERPSVGDDALNQITESIVRLNQRLDAIEKKLK